MGNGEGANEDECAFVGRPGDERDRVSVVKLGDMRPIQGNKYCVPLAISALQFIFEIVDGISGTLAFLSFVAGFGIQEFLLEFFPVVL